MTERLYYGDSYLTRFQARVAVSSADPTLVWLDRTAFYPASGGQPADTGTLAGVPVLDVVDEDDGRIAHRLAGPLDAGLDTVEGVVDWPRRFDHMQQHTGQHLLSAVLAEQFGIATVSFHLGAAVSTIDLAVKTMPDWVEVERAANAEVVRNRPVAISFADAAEVGELRKESGRTGELRIVAIEGLDRSACGGTHVRATGEIGLILLRRTEKVRDTVRLEFVCGLRAAARARADFDHLSRLSRLYSTAVDEVPTVAETQAGRLQEAEKALLKLKAEAARQRGLEAWRATAPDDAGLRRAFWRRPAIDDEVRMEAQGFASGEKAVVTVAGDAPASLLIAASPDSGIHAGNRLKEIIAQAGGRGGGGATLAQGSVPAWDPQLLERLAG